MGGKSTGFNQIAAGIIPNPQNNPLIPIAKGNVGLVYFDRDYPEIMTTYQVEEIELNLS